MSDDSLEVRKRMAYGNGNREQRNKSQNGGPAKKNGRKSRKRNGRGRSAKRQADQEARHAKQ